MRFLRQLLHRLHRDERGNIIVMFSVVMLFTAALAFFVLSAGKRYLQKESVQGAVDAAAFAGAVAEAKAFNILSFLNLVLATGVAIVYTLHALMGGLIGYAVAAGLAIAGTFGTLCLTDPTVCAFEGPSAGYAVRYETQANRLTERLKPLERAAERIAKLSPLLMNAAAIESGTHSAYTQRAPGLVTALIPPPTSIPVEEGPANTVCGPAWLVAENAAAFEAEAMLRVPFPLGPEARLILLGTTTVAEAAAAAIVCEAGTTGLHPRKLKDDWRDDTKVTAMALLADSKVSSRRSAMAIAAGRYGANPGSGPNAMLATAAADVYGHDGKDDEDLWHMSWRARLVLSTPGMFKGLKIPVLSSVWVH